MACALGYFGSISAVIVGIQFIRKVLPWLYENIIGPFILGPKIKFLDYGEWALVTGATDGIGKSYAKQLAKQGLNIVLISRTQAKLESVAAEIVAEYGVETKIISVDFTSGTEIYDKISKEITGLNIGVLVNNVGVSYDYPEYFLDVPNRDTVFRNIIHCNILSVIDMCKIVMPHMISNQKGIILNIASMAGTIPNPLLTVYAASKAFADKFSEDLSTEYSSQGIIVQSVLPGYVVTNMSKLKRTTMLAPSSDKYVASALRTIGYARHTTGYLPHAFLQLFINTIHTYLPDLVNNVTLDSLKKIRSKSLKKKQKSEEKKE